MDSTIVVAVVVVVALVVVMVVVVAEDVLLPAAGWICQPLNELWCKDIVNGNVAIKTYTKKQMTTMAGYGQHSRAKARAAAVGNSVASW